VIDVLGHLALADVPCDLVLARALTRFGGFSSVFAGVFAGVFAALVARHIDTLESLFFTY
jgi:hypothetical protein